MLRTALVLALLFVVTAPPANAQLVVTNLDQPVTGGIQSSSLFVSFSPTNNPVVDAGHFLRITTSMQIVALFVPGGISDTLNAQIFADAGGTPGAVIASSSYTFSVPQIVTDINPVFEFQSFALTDPTYWLGIGAAQNGTEVFYITNSFNQTSDFGWTIGDLTINGIPGTVPQFSIVIVPEPGTYALLAMASVVGYWRWRKRASRVQV